jgi:outer membrane lipoprotein-sorting protein
MTVLAPKEESDKVILAIEKTGQPTEAFSYLAGLKKLAKMDSARQLGFRGAKVTVQELLGMELGQYSHTTGERVTENGEPLIKIEFKAKPNLNLAFPSITGYFREKDQQPARFDLFDESGQVSKKMVFEEIKPVQNHQTISRVAIEDLAQKLKLKLETRKIEYDKGLSDKIFTEDNLKASVTSASQRLDVGR